MIKRLFDANLASVEGIDELEALIKQHPELDPLYLRCACTPYLKALLEPLWPEFEYLADTLYLSELQKHFHERAWEMLIGNILLGIYDKSQITSSNNGPDFIISGQLNVECVCSTKGDKKKNLDTVPDLVATDISGISFQMIKGDPAHIDAMVKLRIYGYGEKSEEEIAEEKAALLTVDRIKMRITQSVKEKAEKFSKWAGKQAIDTSLPYVIALNTADLGYMEDPLMPHVVSALFGTDNRIVSPGQSGIKNPQGWTFTPEVNRLKNGAPVSLIDFLSDKYSMVSGILFSNETVIDNLKNEDGSYILVNNPFATHTIPESFSSHFKRWIAERNGDTFTLKKEY